MQLHMFKSVSFLEVLKQDTKATIFVYIAAGKSLCKWACGEENIP